MAIRKRGDIWWLDITTPNGARLRRSCETTDRKAAQEHHDRLKVDLWRQAKLGEKPKYTWEDAALRWLNEQSHKASIHDDASKIKFLTPCFKGVALEDLNWDRIQYVIESKKGATSVATRNRYYALIRAMLRKAEREWEWIDGAPTIKLHKEPEGRVRYLSPQQIDKLLAVLPEHLADIAGFVFATGLRMGNVVRLRWQQLDLPRRVMCIQAAEIKTRRTLGIPLNEMAMAILKKQQGKHQDAVFTYQGKPIINANTKAWRKALKRAGIDDFRFHDTRHTWASLLIQNGVPKGMIKEMGGWQTEKMVERYAHLAPEHLAPHAAVIDEVLSAQRLKNRPQNTELDLDAQ